MPRHSKPLPQLKPVFSLVLFADAYPDGDGGFLVKPRKPRSLVVRANGTEVVQEVGAIEACKILGIGRGCIHYLVNRDKEGRRRIKWRFSTGKRGRGSRRLFDVQSLLDYVEWTKTVED